MVKVRILKLRNEGKTYEEISKLLKCSKSTISYHCKKIGLGRVYIEDEIKDEIKDYYKTHTIIETAKRFNISESSVKMYGGKKRIILTDEERKEKNKILVIRRRQKLKRIAIKYKGGKCVKCDYDKDIPWIYEFHHTDKEEKDFNISSWSGSEVKMLKELEKCIMVCSNCHREIHYQEYIENKA